VPCAPQVAVFNDAAAFGCRFRAVFRRWLVRRA